MMFCYKMFFGKLHQLSFSGERASQKIHAGQGCFSSNKHRKLHFRSAKSSGHLSAGLSEI